QRTHVTLFDGFPTEPGVQRQDLNALDNLPEAGCDVLTLFRASMFITDSARALAGIHRVLRPGGLAVIDWLHGTSDAPVLDLHTDPRYGGLATPFRTTYCDEIFLREFRSEFEQLVRHVNRPPTWVNVEEPGKRVSWGERTRRALRARRWGHVTVEGYVEAARAALERSGKHLIHPELMEQHFKVRFRSARYFYPNVRKFNLFLLTVLSPVGK
ncbi:MAG TPA: methyltransferase domain-containing protein, partial [Terriglobales bacterium]|nr:methyltransferase domain-containing protein [Terriglobales bacterium]